jgi:hypothetical protein
VVKSLTEPNIDTSPNWVRRGLPNAQIANDLIIEPIGSPLVSVSFTKGMIAADFLGDPTGTGLDGPA